MDRQVARAAILSAGFVGLVVATVAFGASSPGAKRVVATPIRAERWLDAKADRAEALSARSTECLPPIVDANRAYLVEIGRAAFRTPEVLGGQAARAGISCDACHQSGRTNPGFFFPGLSGAPGTADVTSSLFSSHRGDDVDNPVPIPDLSGPRAALKISRDPASPDLARFIHGLIVEEFDGTEPPPAVLAGLTAYVRALSLAACPAVAREQLHAVHAAADASRAVAAAELAVTNGDPATAAAMLLAARAQLGVLNERYPGNVLNPERSLLLTADRDLVRILAVVRAGDPTAAAAMQRWRAQFLRWTRLLEAHERPSLYNPGVLAAAAR